MKTIYRLVAFLLLLAPAVLAQEHYTEGPVWRVSLIRVKPTQWTPISPACSQSSKPILDARRNAMEQSWTTNSSSRRPRPIPKIGTFVSPSNTRTTPPWTASPRKAKFVRDKIIGGKQPAQQLAEKRAEIREVISSELLQEIMLK